MSTDTPAAAPTAEREAMQHALDALEQVTSSETFYRDPRGDKAGPAIDELRAALSAPVAAQPAASGREVLQQALAALGTAHTGLMWYRGMMPEYVDGSDDEADEEITAAMLALRTHLSTALTGAKE